MIKEVTENEAMEIIDNREPQGEFFFIENEKIIAIDNTTGDAWVEEFRNMREFLNWFGGYEKTIKLKRPQ